MDTRGYEIRQSQGRQSVSQSDLPVREGSQDQVRREKKRERERERERERVSGERLAGIHGQYITWQG